MLFRSGLDELFVARDCHAGCCRKPYMVWPRFNEDEVEFIVIKLLRESLSDSDTRYTASDDYDVLLLGGNHAVSVRSERY